MDIVRIILTGREGYDVVRGVITKSVYEEIENSNSLDNVWNKDLNKIFKKNWKIKKEFHDFGIKKGDITVQLNGEEIVNLPIDILEDYIFSDFSLVEEEGYGYPVTNDIVMTSLQTLEGTFMDVIFVTEEEFDFNKFKFVQKTIHDENEKIILDKLISEVYYDGVLLNFSGIETELKMSKVLFDNIEKISKK